MPTKTHWSIFDDEADAPPSRYIAFRETGRNVRLYRSHRWQDVKFFLSRYSSFFRKWIFPAITDMAADDIIDQLVALQPMAGPVGASPVFYVDIISDHAPVYRFKYRRPVDRRWVSPYGYRRDD